VRFVCIDGGRKAVDSFLWIHWGSLMWGTIDDHKRWAIAATWRAWNGGRK